MRALILYGIILFTFFSCKAQEKVTLRYIGNQSSGTENESFINNSFLFLNKNDTIKVNVKTPFNINKMEIINRGIYYNCQLKKDTIYSLTLKKICTADIPEIFNSYYKTNTIPDKTDCSKFTEIKKNTVYDYKGNYEKYVDIDDVLYEVIGLSPDTGCFYPH
ncbi:hypothetical protein [Myroides marinus]|uniref:hypothetical protein n=1 Tax=Myroides marinus TaxID=703342 RepID=UPI002578819D|nr:hypothetical protein [Myroides marinus]MDM1377349.1 hypothetical protein [Myroides marinus]